MELDKVKIQREIYDYYESLLLGGPPFIPSFLEKELEENEIIYETDNGVALCGERIDSIPLIGTTYLLGDVQDSIQIGNKRGIIVRIGKDGACPIEEYSGYDTKFVFYLPRDEGLVFNLDSLEKHIESFGKLTPEEVVLTNLHCFHDLCKKSPEMSEGEYFEEYIGMSVNGKILF